MYDIQIIKLKKMTPNKVLSHCYRSAVLGTVWHRPLVPGTEAEAERLAEPRSLRPARAVL